MSRHVLITADDFGWTASQNAAVEQGAACGTLARASVLANGRAFDEAMEIARRHPGLGVGVHLTLCEGRPLLDGLRGSPLCLGDGGFADGLAPLTKLYLRRRLDRGIVEAIAAEWRAQIRRVQRAGVVLSHLDGHKHVHVLPPLFPLALSLAREFGIPYVRTPVERPGPRVLKRWSPWLALSGMGVLARLRLRNSGLSTADHFVGFGESGCMTRERLLSAIRHARPGLTEIMMHPAQETTGVQSLRDRYPWASTYRFQDELNALVDPSVQAALAAVNGA